MNRLIYINIKVMLLPQKMTIKKRKQMQNIALISVHLIHHYLVLFDYYLIFILHFQTWFMPSYSKSHLGIN